jgi:hypothetical protein
VGWELGVIYRFRPELTGRGVIQRTCRGPGSSIAPGDAEGNPVNGGLTRGSDNASAVIPT